MKEGTQRLSEFKTKYSRNHSKNVYETIERIGKWGYYWSGCLSTGSTQSRVFDYWIGQELRTDIRSNAWMGNKSHRERLNYDRELYSLSPVWKRQKAKIRLCYMERQSN